MGRGQAAVRAKRSNGANLGFESKAHKPQTGSQKGQTMRRESARPRCALKENRTKKP